MAAALKNPFDPWPHSQVSLHPCSSSVGGGLGMSCHCVFTSQPQL